jgi:molecular chaperone IbpA
MTLNTLPTTFDFNRLTPYAVGFDRVFDRLLDYTHHQSTSTGFPPYNIRKVNDTEFCIELAVAGLSQDDLEVEVADGVITVRSTWDKMSQELDTEVLHRGISFKKFTRKFTIADDIVVNGAEMKNGLLTIELERILPEEKKPRLIEIKTSK